MVNKAKNTLTARVRKGWKWEYLFMYVKKISQDTIYIDTETFLNQNKRSTVVWRNIPCILFASKWESPYHNSENDLSRISSTSKFYVLSIQSFKYSSVLSILQHRHTSTEISKSKL